MTKERELLKKALVYLSGLPARTNIQDDIEAYLSTTSDDAEEPARKPMTEEEILELYNQCEEETSVHSTIFHFDKFARAIEARGKVLHPLKRHEIEKAFVDSGYLTGDSRQTCFIQGVRFAEKHHGITDADV